MVIAVNGQRRGGLGVVLDSLQTEDGSPRWCEWKKNRQKDEEGE